uniref:OPA3-like protein n=1 Tax=Oryza meridionalis TaxID=40149 RepID=A0A0E0CJL6_9ORYZ
MILPLAKLGTLALKTMSKPIAIRLKTEASRHPQFRQLIINLAQVAGAAVIFEVQRSARSEARKEEARRNEVEALRQKEDQLAWEIEIVKQKLGEIERQANSRGLSGVLFRSSSAPDQTKAS